MQVKKKEWQQFVPRPIEEIWDYFSRPENLNEMTPDDMDFQILSDIEGVPMYKGMIIQYKVSPVANIKMNWVTEIKQIEEGKYFIDEQRFGPYALWHHQHHFKHQDGGTMMTDLLHYKVPYGFIGSIANAIFVEKRIEEIFTFRKKAVKRIFNF